MDLGAAETFPVFHSTATFMFSADARQMITQNAFSISRHNFVARAKPFSAFSRPIFVASACCSQLGGERSTMKESKAVNSCSAANKQQRGGKNNIVFCGRGKEWGPRAPEVCWSNKNNNRTAAALRWPQSYCPLALIDWANKVGKRGDSSQEKWEKTETAVG